MVVDQDDLTDELLVEKVHELYRNRDRFAQAMADSSQLDSIRTIMKLIDEA